MSASILAGRPETVMMPFNANKLRKRSELPGWPTVNHTLRSSHTSPSKPSWLSSCSCASSTMTVPSVCCYRTASRKMTTTPTDLAPMLTPKNVQNSPTTDLDLTDESCHIPRPVLSLFVYLAQQGGHVNDMFRRPGNITQMELILKELNYGQSVDWSEYNVYTVANVAKRLLLQIPDGLFGVRGETLLLSTASASSCATELHELLDPLLCAEPPQLEHKTVTFADDLYVTGPKHLPRGSVQQLTQLSEVAERRIAVFLRVLEGLPPSHRQLSILMFGLLHQIVMNATSSDAASTLTSLVGLSRSSETLIPKRENAKGDRTAVSDAPLLVLAEGVVKSVTGALFHTCRSSIHLIEQTAQVLRTLVLFFPALGDAVTRFYVDAVADRLLPQSVPSSPRNNLDSANRPFCVLCPETGHEAYFGPNSSDKAGSRQCPLNLIQIASRLFCLSGARATPHKGSFPSVHNTCPPLAKSSNILPRFRCPAFLSKVQSNQEVTISDSTERIPSSRNVVDTIPTPVNASVHSFMVDSAEFTEEAPVTHEDNQTTKYEPTQGLDITVENYVPTLRRNQSRYRSLRRRQMENLSRRAEWFLGTTVLPVVTLTPASKASPIPLRRGGQLSLEEDHNREMVVNSTVSLLELDDSIRRELKESSQRGDDNALSLQPPRLLFVASTGELEQQQPDFDLPSRDTGLIQRKDSGRQRLLSVGSYLIPTPASSFVSVNSAPSAGLHRFDPIGPAVPSPYPGVYRQLECQSAVQFPCISSPPTLQSQSSALFLHPPESLRSCQKQTTQERLTHSTADQFLQPIVPSGSCFSLTASHRLPVVPHQKADEMLEPGVRPRSNSAWAALPTTSTYHVSHT